jgi:hypothetical protein
MTYLLFHKWLQWKKELASVHIFCLESELWAGGVAQVVEHLSSKREALSPNPSKTEVKKIE